MATVLSDQDLLARLVAFDSTSALSNAPIADFVCAYLERPGIAIEQLPGTGDGKVNVLAWAGPACDPESRDGVTLSGHLDVVPAGDRADWTSDPFTLTEADGSYVGRGSCDMKGSIALMCNVMASVTPESLRQPLVLLLTCDEELGTLGAREFVRRWPEGRPLPRSVVIGEPTSLRAVRMHKGHIQISVVVRGRSAHSGSPHLGDNAVVRAASVVRELETCAEQLREIAAPTAEFFPAVPFVVLNVATIRGGEAVNVVPDRCVLDVGVRPLPGMVSAAIFDEVERWIADRFDGALVEVELDNDSPPMLTDDAAPVHRALCEMLGQQESHGVSFSSDGGHLATMGLECVLFGPGNIEVAHRPDEHVPIDELERAGVVLRQLTREKCLECDTG